MTDAETSIAGRLQQVRITVPALLVILALAVLVPLAAFSTFTIRQFGQSMLDIEHERLVRWAFTISATIDRDIRGQIAIGTALAGSPLIDSGNLADFYTEAKQTVQASESNVVLIDLSLQQVVNTRLPFGGPLPKTLAPDAAKRAIQTEAPYVSDVFFGMIAGSMVYNVNVPVIRGGEVKYVLMITSESARVVDLIDQHRLPAGWHVAAVDHIGRVIASDSSSTLPPGEEFAGVRSTSESVPGGFRTNFNILNEAATAAYQRSDISGWTIAVWAPVRVLDDVAATLSNKLYAASFLAIALSALVAYLFSLPLAKLIQQTMRNVKNIGSEQPFLPMPSLLRESSDIQAKLEAAHLELKRRQKENEEGKALLDTLLAHIPEGVTIVGGPDLRVIANSKRAAEWAGRPETELRVSAQEHADAFGIWLPDGRTRPRTEQLPLYRSSRYGETVESENYIMRRPDGTDLRIEIRVNPILNSAGKIIGAISCWRDVTERFAASQIIRDSERRLRLALGVARMAIIDLTVKPGGTAHVINGEAVYGLRTDQEAHELAIPRLLSVVHPDDRPRVEENQKRVCSTTGSFSDEFRILRPGGETAWIEIKGETSTQDDTGVLQVLSTSTDITAHKRSEEQMRLILRELTHRAKNLLAVIQAIATQTARGNTSLKEFLRVFANRIQGLGASHDLLVKSNWTGSPVTDLIRAQLAPFGGVDGERIVISGPPFILKADVLQSLGLALHEMATNAVKYGALSSPDGKVAISWSIDRAAVPHRMVIVWTEQGGPRVRRPQRKGFGHIITISALAQVINGDVRIDYNPGGIVWTVTAPFDAIAKTDIPATEHA